MRRTPSSARHRAVRTAALPAALAALALGAVVVATNPAGAHALATSPTGAHAVAAGSPWTSAHYTPTKGDWHPYVLAPHTHEVAPASVLSADPRGGSITGDPDAVLGSGGGVRLVSTGDRASSPLLTVDFGKEVGGEIQVHVLGASDPAPQLHVCFSESREEMALSPTQNNGEAQYAPGCDTANIWNGYPGTAYTFDSDSHTLALDDVTLPATVQDDQARGGFRYATFFLDGPGSVRLDDVRLRYQAAPAQKHPDAYRGWFLSSDDELNKLWYAGAYTVQTNTWRADTAKSWPYADGEHDHADSQVPYTNPDDEVIFDGAKRDRIVWQGDLSVQAPVTYLSTDDVPAVDNSLTSLADQQLGDGFVPAESLVGQHNQDEIRTYGEYVTWFVSNEYEHWLYTGDRAYLRDVWKPLVAATGWLESVQDQDPQGLIGFGAVNSCGHYGYSDCGHETYVNALFERNLHQMATLAGVLGHDAASTTYSTRATTLANAINAQLWDPAVGAYRLSREIPDAYPQDANATAVLTGVASHARAVRALAYLRTNDWSTYGSLTVSPSTQNPAISPSYEPLPSGFEAEARLLTSAADGIGALQAEQLLKTYWGYQLDQDPGSTYWEKLNTSGDPTIGQFTSLSHGWAAAPTVALTNDTLGVTPTSGGFRTFTVTPHPGTLTWAQGAVPTPHGRIRASWTAAATTFGLRAAVPQGTTASLSVPAHGSGQQVTLDGTLVWNGTKALHGATVTRGGGFVTVSGVRAGAHTVRSTFRAAGASLSVVTTPGATTASAGSLVPLKAQVLGSATSIHVSASGPQGWAVHPASRTLSALGAPGRPAARTLRLSVTVPDDVAPGRYPVTVTATSGAVTARGTTTITVLSPGYDFDDGTDGWQAGDNSASVSAVTSFANGPGTCVSGGCLAVASDAVPATTVRSAYVVPDRPIDMSDASSFDLSFDSYGGVPDATGYQATVTLTSTDGTSRTDTFTTSPDQWTPLSLDIGGWAGASSVSRIEVGFAAVGTTYSPWSSTFEIDDLNWS